MKERRPAYYYDRTYRQIKLAFENPNHLLVVPRSRYAVIEDHDGFCFRALDDLNGVRDGLNIRNCRPARYDNQVRDAGGFDARPPLHAWHGIYKDVVNALIPAKFQCLGQLFRFRLQDFWRFLRATLIPFHGRSLRIGIDDS